MHTLVVLAAGEGSRYGGLKQLECVGPCGATLIDYTIYSARRAGFERAVFVTRPGTQSSFEEHFGKRLRPHMDVAFCLQHEVALRGTCPGGRRVWGTGHAVLAAADEIDGPFAVANADDFYGADALRVVRSFLSGIEGVDDSTIAVVGYPLGATLSDAGPVSRALCHVGSSDELMDIVEIVGIERREGSVQHSDSAGVSHVLEAGTLVSMNLWAFSTSILDLLRDRFERWTSLTGASDDAEFRLPAVVGELVMQGIVRAKVLRTDSPWFGLTYRQDRRRVEDEIRSLIEAGDYPLNLWE